MARPVLLPTSAVLATAFSLVWMLATSPAQADAIPPGGYKPCFPGSELARGGAGHRYCKSVPVDCTTGTPACSAGTSCKSQDFCVTTTTVWPDTSTRIENVVGYAKNGACDGDSRAVRRNVCMSPEESSDAAQAANSPTDPSTATSPQPATKGRAGCGCTTMPATADSALAATMLALGLALLRRKGQKPDLH
jgi:MYXO-CTERM domain-containing protein